MPNLTRMHRTLPPALLLAGLLCLPGALLAQANVTLNLKDADINSLIATVSEVTGRNFIVDPRVRGKVTVISSQPMTAEGVYETFLAALQVQGFAVIRVGEAYKIVPETNARQDGGAVGPQGRNAADEIVTHVYSLNNVSAAQLVPILRPLVPQWGHLAAYAPSNMLIIADRASNVARLDRVIRRMDQGGDREIETVRLEHAAASEVVRILTTLAQADQAQEGGSKPATLIADERSNSVLIGGDKAERQKFLDIIGTLDIELKGDGATQVIYLRYASAENLAPILEGYAEQVNQAEATAASGGEPGTGTRTRSTREAGTRVLADPDTNALIVTAPPKIMRQVRDVIAQLDIRRAQVLVEAVIAEVSAEKSSQLGVDWAVFNNDRVAAAGILDPNTLQALGGAAAQQGGISPAGALGLIGQGINVGIGRRGSNTTFGVLIKALQGDGDTNILSTPTLVTLDNQEASFSAGQEVPFLTGSFSNTGVANQGGVVNPFQTIERRDVGLTLGVTPQINEGNVVKLLLDLEVSSLASGAAGGANLITNKRTLTNTVAVENGQILVIGGLIDDTLTDTERAVPLLGSIPILGNLFKFRSVEKVKRNLMVFIRPSILRSEADGDYYTRRKYDAVRNAQIEASGASVPLVGGRSAVMLPFEEYRRQTPPPPPTELPDRLPPAGTP